jgi:adenine-specific DNA-methyltransferase
MGVEHWIEPSEGILRNTSWQDIFASKSTEEVKGLFDFPKNPDAIKLMIDCVGDEIGIILDFFAGSASTAQAVLEKNIEEDKSLRFICVQLPEIVAPNSNVHELGFKNIADISKERIRRAAKKIKAENPDYDGDLGFKVFKLDSSNIKRWDANFETLEQDLLGAVDYIKQERSSEDVLYELLLKYGLDLTVPIETRTIAGKTIYSIGLGALVVCLEKDVSMDVVNGIGALKEELNPEIMRVVFKDEGFKDDVVKTNALQTLKRYGIEDIKSL